MIEPIKVVADILRIELGLDPDQVLLYNQKFDIPSDTRMYLFLSLMGMKTFGSRLKYVNDPVTNELTSETGVNRQEMYSIGLYSRSDEARIRNWEVVAALHSDTSERLQEANTMKLAQIPTSMADVSEVEGTARLSRYSLTIMALVVYQKKQSVPFFDAFNIPPVVVSNP